MTAGNRPVIVSLTSISSRVARLDSVISALLAQTIMPDKIVLNVSDHPFLLDEGVEFTDLPPMVRKLAITGRIELNFVRNIGSYRKLVPTLRRYRSIDCLIVTADDDAIYPPGWIEGLVEAYENHGCVAAYRCRTAPCRNGAIRPYAEWAFITEQGDAANRIFFEAPQKMVFPTGRGGVLYHPAFFTSIDLLGEFRDLAPAQDDLAFRMATLIAKIPVIAVPFSRSGASRQDFGGTPVTVELWKKNLTIKGGLSENDRALNAIWNSCLQKGLLKPDDLT